MRRGSWVVLVISLAACSKDPTRSSAAAGTGAGAGAGTAAGTGAGTAAGTGAGAGSPLSGDLRALPRPVPRGNILIRYDCFHSNMPFGKGSQSSATLIDLAKATIDSTSIVDDGSDDEVAPEPQGGTPTRSGSKTTHSTNPLGAERAARLQQRLAAVLAGGPYRCEYPPSEGVSCQLALQIEGQPQPFFSVDKAFTREQDAASELVRELGGAPGN